MNIRNVFFFVVTLGLFSLDKVQAQSLPLDQKQAAITQEIFDLREQLEKKSAELMENYDLMQEKMLQDGSGSGCKRAFIACKFYILKKIKALKMAMNKMSETMKKDKYLRVLRGVILTLSILVAASVLISWKTWIASFSFWVTRLGCEITNNLVLWPFNPLYWFGSKDACPTFGDFIFGRLR